MIWQILLKLLGLESVLNSRHRELVTRLNEIDLSISQIRLQISDLNRICEEILTHFATSARAVRIVFNAVLDGKLYLGVENMILTSTQKVELSIQPVDAKGNPAVVDGEPVWATSNPDVVSLEVAEGGMSCTAVAVGPVGTAQVAVTADADLGEGVAHITGLLDLEVMAGAAVNLQISAGIPTEQ